jgi:hypothetical protein
VNSEATIRKFAEEERKKLLREKAKMAVNVIRQQAKAAGLDKMTLEEINAEIAEVRREMSAKKCFA